MKLKVFGSSGVGKSCLVKSLTVGFFGKYFKRLPYAATVVRGGGVFVGGGMGVFGGWVWEGRDVFGGWVGR